MRTLVVVAAATLFCFGCKESAGSGAEAGAGGSASAGGAGGQSAGQGGGSGGSSGTGGSATGRTGVADASTDAGDTAIAHPDAREVGDGLTEAGGASGYLPCLYPHPYVVGNKPTGLYRCDNGVFYRERAVDCPSLLPRANSACTMSAPPGVVPEACAQDSDCKRRALGTCGLVPGHFPACGCAYGCVRDSDCGAGELCECGEPTGVCRPAGCVDNASCAPGSLCASVATTFGGCSWVPPVRGYQCQAKGDTCMTDMSCAAPTPSCAFSSVTGVRSCHEGQLACP
jgi:hypothetical protein